jgi:MOSC domain-containing protein YiiM
VAALVQLNVSPGGMPKLPIDHAPVTEGGVPGDKQLDRKYHGGPDRAICIYSIELYDWLREDHGLDLTWGSLGENFTTEGLDLNRLEKGSRLRVGGCTIEITKVRTPCHKLKQWDPLLPEIIVGRSGWVAKVIEPGEVKPGDDIEVLAAR